MKHSIDLTLSNSKHMNCAGFAEINLFDLLNVSCVDLHWVIQNFNWIQNAVLPSHFAAFAAHLSLSNPISASHPTHSNINISIKGRVFALVKIGTEFNFNAKFMRGQLLLRWKVGSAYQSYEVDRIECSVCLCIVYCWTSCSSFAFFMNCVLYAVTL